MGHATGIDLSPRIIDSMTKNRLPLKQLITLGSDGPNVNKTVFNIVSQKKIDLKLAPLADIGTCNLHVVHES